MTADPHITAAAQALAATLAPLTDSEVQRARRLLHPLPAPTPTGTRNG